MSQWLLDRLFAAKNQSEPHFAFQGTVNWMRALAFAAEVEFTSDEKLGEIYMNVQRRTVNNIADTNVFENIFMAHHNLASLFSLRNDIKHPYDICRSAIVTWYYIAYFSASAMVAAASGSTQESHAGTARAWQNNIVDRKLIPYPFNLHLSSLVSTTMEEEIMNYRGDNIYNLKHPADNLEEAHGGLVSSLKGTHRYQKLKVEEQIKRSKEFKELDVENFRKKAAQKLRDKILKRSQVNYLVQAFRFRGKANYRDSIFLSYGPDHEEIIWRFLGDLLCVSVRFIKSAAFYSSMRVERGSWDEFINDIEDNSRLSINTDIIRI